MVIRQGLELLVLIELFVLLGTSSLWTTLIACVVLILAAIPPWDRQRKATAVFTFRDGHWTTDGRVV